jgi:hypothetical protein
MAQAADARMIVQVRCKSSQVKSSQVKSSANFLLGARARLHDVSANVAKTLRRALMLASSLQNLGAPPHAGRCFSCLARCCLARAWMPDLRASVPAQVSPCLGNCGRASARRTAPRSARSSLREVRKHPSLPCFPCGATAVLPVAAAACALGHGSCHAGSCGATPSPPALLSQRECAAAASQASSTRTS